MTRTCAICRGRTYGGAPNNWVCHACWQDYCADGAPAWVRYLVAQTRWETRHGLAEYDIVAENGTTTTVLLRRGGH